MTLKIACSSNKKFMKVRLRRCNSKSTNSKQSQKPTTIATHSKKIYWHLLINVRDKILREKEIEHLNDTLSNLKHELKETKERSSHEISSLRSSFTQEKNALAKRLEESNLTISQNNVKIMSLEQSLDSEIKNCERVKRELEKYLTEKQADYVAVKGQLENLAKEYKDESDKWLETHNEDSKNLALQKQKVCFQKFCLCLT